jgi:hypothetical protein
LLDALRQSQWASNLLQAAGRLGRPGSRIGQSMGLAATQQGVVADTMVAYGPDRRTRPLLHRVAPTGLSGQPVEAEPG